MSREVLKQALEALQKCEGRGKADEGDRHRAITALRQALEQPADEPVAEPTEDMVLALRGASGLGTEDAIDALRDVLAVMPLYTRPQPAAQWVGLTDEEIIEAYETSGHKQTLRPQDVFAVASLSRAIEAKLKEKNGGGV